MFNRGSVPVLDALMFVHPSSNQCFRIETSSVLVTSLLTYLLVWSSVPCDFMRKILVVHYLQSFDILLLEMFLVRGVEGVCTHDKCFAESFRSGGDIAGVERKAEVVFNFARFPARCPVSSCCIFNDSFLPGENRPRKCTIG